MIELYYADLERITSLSPWDLLAQTKTPDGRFDKETEAKIKTERKVLMFSINNGDLSAKSSRVDISGNANPYPSKDGFSDDELDYLKLRLINSKNPIIRSRYAHLLWRITKHLSYADVAIDCYINSIKISKDNSESEVPIYVSCILLIGEKLKKRRSEIKSVVLDILMSNKYSNYLRFKILEFSIESSYIKGKDLDPLLEEIKSWVDLKNPSKYFQNQTFLRIAIRLSEKLHYSTRYFYQLYALNQDLIINQHPDDKDFVKMTSIGEKAQLYKKAGDLENYNLCLIEYTRLKKIFELDHFTIEFPEDASQLHNEYLNIKVDWLLNMSSDDILAYFSNSDEFLIKDQDLNKLTENALEKSMHHLFSTNTFDVNSNFKKVDEKDANEIERFRIYSMHFSLFALSLVLKVFAIGMMTGKVTYYTFIQYLINHSWYGQKFHLSMTRDIDNNTSWISLLSPGLFDFFNQIEYSIIFSDELIESYMLSIDSLTLKFEGALRDYIRLNGGSTTSDKKGVMQELTLEELLMNSVIKKQFKIEDITLFRYVFTNHGWNLRNNVAHCFYPYSSYSFDKAAIVLLCLLRLGRYKLATKKK